MDWNNDGKLDILSGCYWTEGANAGQTILMLGQGDNVFKEGIPLTNEAGKPLENIIISKEGYETEKGQSAITEAICTHQHAIDLDGDGDLDIVNGCFGSSFYYYENKGSAEKPAISAEPIKMSVESTSYHAAPHLADWDNDGDLDLLTGTGGGGVLISFNEGTAKEPQWKKFQKLIDKSDKHEQVLIDGEEIQPAPSTRIWAHDWNGDGWLDLLVGDSATIVKPTKGLSLEEFRQKEKDHYLAVAEASNGYAEVAQRFQKAQSELKEDEEMDEELKKEFEEAQESFFKLRETRNEWCESSSTGHVWLYLRKPPTQDERTSKSSNDVNR